MKVTKFNEERKIFNVINNNKQKCKVDYVNKVVEILEGNKVIKTLKSERLTREYIESCTLHLERKKAEEEKKKNKVDQAQQDQQENVSRETIEDQQVNNVLNYIEEKKVIQQDQQENVSCETIENEVKEVNEVEEKEVIQQENVSCETFENPYNIPYIPTFICKEYCKAHKQRLENGALNRYTQFSVFIDSESQEFNKKATQLIIDNIENHFKHLDLHFDKELTIEYKKGNLECIEITMNVPLMENMSKIRAEIHTWYFDSKKKIKAINKAQRLEIERKIKEEKKANKQLEKEKNSINIA